MADEMEKLEGKGLVGRPANELQTLLTSRREDLRKARFKHALNQLQKTHTLTVLRRDIARLKTALAHQPASLRDVT